jgi:threonylcarbamoyladenosine tRNA methylthiotransferase MtaB
MRIFLDSIGCRLNQSEIENYARQFRSAGHTLVSSAGEADLSVINTCTVTNAADSDSRGKIRQAVRAGSNQVVVTGCWSTLNPVKAAQLTGVTKVIPNQNKGLLVPEILGIPSEDFDLEPIARELIPGVRLRTRAFIKAQDGCDNHCTFCITTIARGAGKSRVPHEIIEDIAAALNDEENMAAKEIILTGVRLGSWGKDLPDQQNLSDLIKMILAETDVPRLRISSIEPWDLDDDFFNLFSDTRLCRHVHLPLQSGSATVLRRMARNTTPEKFSRLVSAARQACPDIAISTDLITGFPGETEYEFNETIEFVRSMSFSGGHVFTYSARPGTAAENLPDQVDFPVRKERNAKLRQLLADSSQKYQNRFLNQTLFVLWETVTRMDSERWHLHGLSDNYLRVHAHARKNLWNQITPVRASSWDEKGLIGHLITTA